jgi:hypothetical protein
MRISMSRKLSNNHLYKKFLFIILIFFGGVVLFNCNLEQKDKDKNSSGVPKSQSKEIGPEGGSIISTDGNWQLEIPAGALEKKTQISVTENAKLDEDIPEVYESCSTVFKLEPDGLNFLIPVMFSFKYDQLEFSEASIKEKLISMYYINDDSTVDRISTSIDLTQNSGVAELTHFSIISSLTVKIEKINDGTIFNPNLVENVANDLIDYLNSLSGTEEQNQFIADSSDLLMPFLGMVESILGYNPVSNAFPDLDFDILYVCDPEGDVSQSCYSGADGTEGIGQCQSGTQTCIEGFWGDCEGEVLPDAELCDNKDNNCDGSTDEELTRACGSDVGACQKGIETCTTGQWGICVGEIGPVAELCNNTDDNCDGDIDEDLSNACGSDVGECQLGTETCSEGQWGTCVGAIEPVPEVCDNKDNNCNGLTDENLTRICGSDVGECQTGTETCTTGQWGICVGAIGPIPEICGDGKDNNCDGNTDEGCP